MQTSLPYESNIYYENDPAQLAVARLHSMGYEHDEISVIMNDKTREKALAAMTNAKGSEGIAAGAAIGGVLGAIVAGMTATGAIAAIAGTGGVILPLVAGPLAAALAGLGAGAAGGGIVGGLIGVGIAEHDAKEYEKGLREGGILVAVRPKSASHREHVRRALDREELTSTGDIDRSVEQADDVRLRRTPH